MAETADVLLFLDSEMEQPELFGWFHILWLFLVTAGTVLLCKFFPQGTDRQVRTVLLAVSITVILLEIYKQINYTFQVNDSGQVEADFQWYAFPFQFCSMPMYIGLLAGLTRKGRFHRAMCAFLASYAIFAGVCVMVYPGDVFIRTIGINIQTMICHGTMITVGVYLLYTNYVPSCRKTLFRAMLVFSVCVLLAAVMNEVAYQTGLLETDEFNMFFISPHCDPSLPVYSLVQEVMAFPLSLIAYIFGFSVAAGLILLVSAWLKKLARKKATA